MRGCYYQVCGSVHETKWVKRGQKNELCQCVILKMGVRASATASSLEHSRDTEVWLREQYYELVQSMTFTLELSERMHRI